MSKKIINSIAYFRWYASRLAHFDASSYIPSRFASGDQYNWIRKAFKFIGCFSPIGIGIAMLFQFNWGRFGE
jgi:hypothetical protein